MSLLSVSSKIVLNYSVTQLLSFILTVCFFLYIFYIIYLYKYII